MDPHVLELLVNIKGQWMWFAWWDAQHVDDERFHKVTGVNPNSWEADFTPWRAT